MHLSFTALIVCSFILIIYLVFVLFYLFVHLLFPFYDVIQLSSLCSYPVPLSSNPFLTSLFLPLLLAFLPHSLSAAFRPFALKVTKLEAKGTGRGKLKG